MLCWHSFSSYWLALSNDVNTVSSDAVIPCLVFMGILSFLGVNTDFKLFIENGLSRWTIFLVNFVVMLFYLWLDPWLYLYSLKYLAAISFLIFNYQ